ncbi:uncharacterized protein LOC128199637 [Bicyclus anynana]|uniref:Uncharacterized protein LOC128199637 n=1 Tax=Bicyclus anynana TaxID=110368 RepID=A0ABM3M4A8_BICAN|nr:uncharacterized protein LOC128199637 [Bicyclus anynana]
MENQMELLLNKIKEEMALQTKQITETVLESLDKKLASVIEENKALKTKVETLQHKIDSLEDNKRRHNLIFFGVNEMEQEGSLIDYTKTIIERETNTNIQSYEINTVQRLGAKGKGTRPLLVGFTSIWKRNQILRNKYKKGDLTRSDISIKEDYSKEVLLKRKELVPQLLQEREKGKIAYLKKDILIIKDPKETNQFKRKRDSKESPNDKTNTTRPASKKTNTNNILDYAYAPTDKANEDEICEFYKDLNQAHSLADDKVLDIDNLQPVEQAGFRSGFSTIDHIQTIEQIMEKYREFNRSLYVAFIDYSKAFDSINHSAIWKALYSLKIDQKYINIIKNIYENSTSKVKLETSGEPFNIERGVRQGDPLSPKLFIAVLQDIFSKMNWAQKGILINGNYLNHLRFADDIVIMAESPKDLEEMITTLDQESKKVGLDMNTDKTKIMTNTYKRPIQRSFNGTPETEKEGKDDHTKDGKTSCQKDGVAKLETELSGKVCRTMSKDNLTAMV